MKDKKESFVVVGAGRVGTAMAKVLTDAGYPCLALFGRTGDKIKRSSQYVGTKGYTRLKAETIRKADIVLVAVPDDQIKGMIASLVDASAVSDGSTLIHFSGLVTSSVLFDKRISRCGRASAHPNLAFADYAAAADRIKGTFFGIEGDPKGMEVAEKIIRDIGGIGVIIPSGAKTAYHLAAVFSSNGMVVLSSIATSILKDSGVAPADAEKIISKLMLGTAQNLHDLGTLKALTGPVVRGDNKTVSAHLDVLKNMSSDLRKIYCLLFKRMVGLGIEAERGTEEVYKPIIKLLDENLLD